MKRFRYDIFKLYRCTFDLVLEIVQCTNIFLYDTIIISTKYLYMTCTFLHIYIKNMYMTFLYDLDPFLFYFRLTRVKKLWGESN